MKMTQNIPKTPYIAYGATDWVVHAFMPQVEHDVEIRKMLAEMEAYINSNYKDPSLYAVTHHYFVESFQRWTKPHMCIRILKDLAENKPEWFEQLQILKFEKDLLG